MYYTTGFSREQITDLCAAINRQSVPGKNAAWPPSLGLFRSVVVTLTYLRRNRVQHELAETYGVSQPTISRAIAAITPVLGEALADYVPTADELDPRTQYSSTEPCSRAGHGRRTRSCTQENIKLPA